MGPIVDRTKEHLGRPTRSSRCGSYCSKQRGRGSGEAVRGVDPSAYRHVRPVDHKIARASSGARLADELQAKF